MDNHSPQCQISQVKAFAAEYSHINNQLFGSETNPVSLQEPTMGGFYQDLASYHDHMEQIMQSYTPEELPVLNGLARHFAVSDRYFCSVPTQTNCNRAFAAGGNSLGINDKGQLEAWVNNRNFSFTDLITGNRRLANPAEAILFLERAKQNPVGFYDILHTHISLYRAYTKLNNAKKAKSTIKDLVQIVSTQPQLANFLPLIRFYFKNMGIPLPEITASSEK